MNEAVSYVRQKAIENSSKTGFKQDGIETKMQHREAGMNFSAPKFREMTYGIIGEAVRKLVRKYVAAEVVPLVLVVTVAVVMVIG